ncbi:minor capsid protein [Ruminococcus sp. OA3]|uniref:minor capsid protein n=1 Tax=Ruminococcus sp. OA3 TaxID=2914164 RepID=UPI001F05E1B1|nr:minor capsid protein [Ruminococcus sp. OA3]MCH1984167.1 minor capsid protein [Ruminococcus sp. OA3]
MPKISTRVTFNKMSAMARIRAAANDGLTIMAQQALKDTTQHVPKDQGTLQSSGLANSDFQARDLKYEMRWSEPYAQYLWHGEVMYGNPTARTYGPEKITFTSALARMEWAKYAKEVYGKDWKKVYQAAMRRRLRQ